jgi:hypothetical protein
MCDCVKIEFTNSDHPFALCTFYVLVQTVFSIPQSFCIVLLYGILSIDELTTFVQFLSVYDPHLLKEQLQQPLIHLN